MDLIGTDLFEVAGQTWMAVADCYSGYTWARRLHSTTTEAVAKHLDAIFMDVGFPRRIRSDGGPQFRGKFDSWCQQRHIVHELSSAYYPQSNGLAEAAVKKAKHIILKCKETKQDLALAMLALRNSPRDDGISPALAFFGRHLRGHIPIVKCGLIPISQDWRLDRAAAMKSKHDKYEPARELSLLSPGTEVRILHPSGRGWTGTGFIRETRSGGRSYLVCTSSGKLQVRNRSHLRPFVGQDGGLQQQVRRPDGPGQQGRPDRGVQRGATHPRDTSADVGLRGSPVAPRRSPRLLVPPHAEALARLAGRATSSSAASSSVNRASPCGDAAGVSQLPALDEVSGRAAPRAAGRDDGEGRPELAGLHATCQVGPGAIF